MNNKLRVYSDITELIPGPDNPTPLVRLSKITSKRKRLIYLKLERYNPFGSVKDRIAYEMLKALNVKGKKVIEPSSGNTGIALVCIANALGIPVEIAVPKGIPEEKKVMLKLLGAEVREADDNLCPLFPNEGARGLVKAIIESPATKDSYVSPNQYENKLNVLAHYRTTGPEIWKQTQGRIKYFFAGFGTCGTITGVGRFLKEKNSKVKIIGVEPTSPQHKLPGMKRISGLAKELIPKILDMSVIDDVIEVSDENAYKMAIELARKEGILSGPTTGAILYAALNYNISDEGLIVVISPDDAFKYTSFYKEFLEIELKTQIIEYDLTEYVCPLSKIKASELINNMKNGETIKIILGDKDSLQSVAKELKERNLKFEFREEAKNRYTLTITK
jgi:cysteine synthase A/cysteine synthase B